MAIQKLLTEVDDIRRYFGQLAKTKAAGIIRPVQNPGLGVKFRFGNVRLKSPPYAVQAVEISRYGLERLKEFDELDIEVFGQSRRVSFTTVALQFTDKGVWVDLPKELTKAERRSRARHPMSPKQCPFFDLGDWDLDPMDITAPPVFGLYKPISNWCMVADLSFGGICIETRFPAIIKRIEASKHFRSSRLIIPMKEPLKIATELRWTKRIREPIKVDNGLFVSIQKYRFGIQFKKPSREFLQYVAEYLKSLQVAEEQAQKKQERLAHGA